jgi:hypothetical protein
MLWLPETYLEDAWLAQLACLHYALCVFAMACFLRSSMAQSSRPARIAFGLLDTAVLLFVQPFIYASPTQTYGIGLASCCCLAAWSLLHWSFMEPLHSKPSVLSVCLSVVTHPMAGVIKVHQRLRPRPAHSKASSTGRPLVVVDATTGDMQLLSEPTGSTLLSRLISSLATMLGVCICYDAGLYLLCTFSSGMCSPASAPAATTTWRTFLATSVFSYAAGSLLPLQMDIMFCLLRACMYAGAFVHPPLGDYADQLPPHAFNWPAAAGSISELWGRRWHQFLRTYFQGLGPVLQTSWLAVLHPLACVSTRTRWLRLP